MPSGAPICVCVDSATGHRLKYLSHVVAYALSKGERVVAIVPPGAVKSSEMNRHMAGLSRQVELQECELPGLDELAAIALRRGCAKLVILDGDRYLLPLASKARWPAPCDLRLLIMREEGQGGSTLLPKFLRTQLKRFAVLLVNRMARVKALVLKPSDWPGRSVLPVVRDPVCAPDVERTPLAANRFWFGVFGAITPRKNLDLILQAMRRDAPNYGLLVQGKFERGLMEAARPHFDEISRAGCEVILNDTVVSDESLGAGIASVDCVILAHSNEGPSGIFSLAMAYGTPVLAAGARSLHREASRVGPRAKWVPLRIESLTSGMAEMAAHRRRFSPRHGATPAEFASQLLK